MTYWPRLGSLDAGRPTPCIQLPCLFATLHLALALPPVATHSDPDPLALLLLGRSDPSALTADAGYPSEAMRTHSRDPALLGLDQLLAIPGHCPPWEGPRLQSWGHCFCRDPFCLLKMWYLVIKGYHWLELSLCLFSWRYEGGRQGSRWDNWTLVKAKGCSRSKSVYNYLRLLRIQSHWLIALGRMRWR